MTRSIGAPQMGHPARLLSRSWAHAVQQHEWPVIPCIIVASLGPVRHTVQYSLSPGGPGRPIGSAEGPVFASIISSTGEVIDFPPFETVAWWPLLSPEVFLPAKQIRVQQHLLNSGIQRRQRYNWQNINKILRCVALVPTLSLRPGCKNTANE